MDTIEILPEEIVTKIFSFLEKKDMGTCRSVCKRWRSSKILAIRSIRLKKDKAMNLEELFSLLLSIDQLESLHVPKRSLLLPKLRSNDKAKKYKVAFFSNGIKSDAFMIQILSFCPRLTNLHIDFDDESTFSKPYLHEIAAFCPNLASISFMNCDLELSVASGSKDSIFGFSKQPTNFAGSVKTQPFFNIKSLALDSVALPYDDVSVCFEMFTQLNYLSLNGITCRKALTRFDVGNLTSLEELNLHSWFDLEDWTPGIYKLPSLKRWTVGNCDKLVGVPSDVRKLQNLRSLRKHSSRQAIVLDHVHDVLFRAKQLIESNNLRRIHSIQLPESFLQLPHLEELHLEFSFTILNLTENLSKLSTLKCLSIKEYVLVLPDCIGNLTNLEELSLSFHLYRHVPDSLSRLKNLKTLRLSCVGDISSFEFLVSLQSLRNLELSLCPLHEIPASIWKLTRLQFLHLSHFFALESISSSISSLSSLRVLSLSDNLLLKNLPSALLNGDMASLVEIRTKNCPSLDDSLKSHSRLSGKVNFSFLGSAHTLRSRSEEKYEKFRHFLNISRLYLSMEET